MNIEPFEINNSRNQEDPDLWPQPVEVPESREPSTPYLREVPGFKINRKLDFDERVGFTGGPKARRKGYQLVAWSVLASTIDTLIMISASCVFLLTFSLIVHAPIGSFIKTFASVQSQSLFFLEVFVALTWTYGIFARSLVGFTLGEWTCDLRLGQPHERIQDRYIFRVIFRSTLVLVTGGIVLPALSLFFGKDIAGNISGLKLFSLK